MKRISVLTTILVCLAGFAFAQPQTREELEKQKQQLKKELQETEKMLTENKSRTKENFLQWKLIKDKVNIQDRLIENINNDINLLDRSLSTTQRDINKYDRLLDTLKEEYAKSMVYAYKNRGSYDFLNFIFSAASFNDAIKRIAYLKSYRNYREMQGENIIRTQEMRKQRVAELTGTKEKKNIVLQSKDKELSILETQQKEKDRILNELKKKGAQLNNQYAAKSKQLKRVEGAIAANIKRAIEEAKKLAAKKAADIEARRLADIKAAAKTSTPSSGTNTKSVVTAPVKKTTPKKVEESILVTDENRAVNTSFVANRGSLPWPVSGKILMHFGSNELPSGRTIVLNNTTIATEIGSPIKAIFGGIVTLVMEDETGTVVIQHGSYFTTYSNLSNVTVKRGQQVSLGQVIGRAMANLDGIGAVDFFLQDERKYYDPEKWLRR